MTVISNDGNAPNIGRDSSNRAYNRARAEWHRHRAAVAADSSAKILHAKFVALYNARADGDHEDDSRSNGI